MGKWYFGVCLFMLFAIGCESTSFNHRNNEIMTPQSRGKATLTALPHQSSEDIIASSEKKNVYEKSKKVGGKLEQKAEPFPTVYFSFDSWEVTPDVRRRLDATAEWLTRFPHYELTIEGHTDVRGTESYNMVLGAKRAQAVKEYLKNLGIPSRRVDVVSFGQNLMLCEIDDESKCHQFNRRAELLLE